MVAAGVAVVEEVEEEEEEEEVKKEWDLGTEKEERRRFRIFEDFQRLLPLSYEMGYRGSCRKVSLFFLAPFLVLLGAWRSCLR